LDGTSTHNFYVQKAIIMLKTIATQSVTTRVDSILHMPFSAFTKENSKYLPLSLLLENTDVVEELMDEVETLGESSYLFDNIHIRDPDFKIMLRVSYLEVYALKTCSDDLLYALALWDNYSSLILNMKAEYDKEDKPYDKTSRQLAKEAIGMLEETVYREIQAKRYLNNERNYKCLYILYNPDTDVYKISLSDELELKTPLMICGGGSKLELVYISPKIYYHFEKVESTIHRKYEKKNICSDWFNLTIADVRNIKNVLVNAGAVHKAAKVKVTLPTIKEYKKGKVYKYKRYITDISGLLKRIAKLPST